MLLLDIAKLSRSNFADTVPKQFAPIVRAPRILRTQMGRKRGQEGLKFLDKLAFLRL